MGLPGVPAVVMDVEVTEALPAIPPVRADGARTPQVWLLVRRFTEPIDLVRLAVPDVGLTPSDVGTALGGSVPSGGSAYLDGRAKALAAAPSLTVAVCTRNRPESLTRTLESVLGQDYPAVRVLVVDNAPSDGATAAVAKSLGVDYLKVSEPGLSRARNAALAEAAGQTVAWLDDDEVADPYWLGEIARGLSEHPDADVLCGSIVPAELETAAQLWFEQFGGLVKGRGLRPAVFSRATRRTFNPLFPLPPFGAGANMVTRPGVVERTGGFDPALGAGSPAMGGEDTLFFSALLRAGGTIAYQPSILTRHYHRRDLDGLRTQLVGYGTGLTAAYAALLRRDPVAAAGLVGLVPRAARELVGRGGARTATIGADFPAELLRANRRAMLRGPSAYRRGRSVDPRRRGVASPTLPATDPGTAEWPLVTVVVASSFVRKDMLGRCVAALGKLDYPRCDVIVVDNRVNPDEDDWSALRAAGNVRVVAQPRPGASAARNLGLAEAAGEIVAFTDDDTAVDPDWLRAIVGRFRAEPDTDCVTGRVVPAELETPAQRLFEASGNAFTPNAGPASYAGGPFTVTNRLAADPYRSLSIYRMGGFGTGSNMAVRTEVLRELGGFDEALGPGTPARAGEDILLFLRLLAGGHRLAYEPDALVRHWHRRELDELEEQTRSYGIGLTAMLTAAVRRDPRHLWGLARVTVPAVTMVLRGEATRTGTPGGSASGGLVAAKRRGMLIGPVAYLRGRRRMRAWR